MGEWRERSGSLFYMEIGLGAELGQAASHRESAWRARAFAPAAHRRAARDWFGPVGCREAGHVQGLNFLTGQRGGRPWVSC